MLEYNKHHQYYVDISYEITLKCNNRCSYCYNLAKLDNRTHVHEETFNHTIEQINKFVNEHPEYTVNVNLLGGEPLLVKEKVIELLERISNKVTVDIYANLNYKGSHLNGIEKYPNASVVCSWHESSDPDLIKENLLAYKGKIETSFFVSDANFDTMYEHAMWAAENGIFYRIESIRGPKQEYLFTGFETEKYKTMFTLGRSMRINQGINKPDDLDLGLSKDQLRYVSRYYHTICKINQYSITYDGMVMAGCDYPYRSHISKGLEIKEVYCPGYMCYCDTGAYKKLTKKLK